MERFNEMPKNTPSSTESQERGPTGPARKKRKEQIKEWMQQYRKSIIAVLRGLSDWEHFTAGGKGGQGMQQVNTARASQVPFEALLAALPEEFRENVKNALRGQVSEKGNLRWESRERGAAQNVEAILERASKEIIKAFWVPPKRYGKVEPQKIKKQKAREAASRRREKEHASRKKQERRYRPEHE